MRKILPSITSLGLSKSSWRDKIAELHEFKIAEVALFLTGLSNSERHECFQELTTAKRSWDFVIPFCHAVSAMCEDEYLFLIENFSTKRFNLHPTTEYPLEHQLSEKLRRLIYIENSRIDAVLSPELIQGFAGVCLDVSHLYDLRTLSPDLMPAMCDFLDRATIGANHISAASLAPKISKSGLAQCSEHYATSMDSFDYLNLIPISYLSDYCAIEVENSLREQLNFKQQIESILISKEATLKLAA